MLYVPDMATLPLDGLDGLYRSHSDWLSDWLAVRARCSTLASDLMQETFCRIAARPDVQLHSHPRRYLATIARRLLIDHSRRRGSERCFLEAYARLNDGLAQPSPERIAAAAQELDAIVALLQDLPDPVRRAFLLSRVDGRTYADIANELGVSCSMVKQYVARAFAHCYELAHGCPD